MARATTSPLSVDHMRAVNDALRHLTLAQEVARKAATCGYDCQAHADVMSYYQARLEAVRREFGQPTRQT